MSRTSAPSRGFVLLNRLSSDNLQEMVHPGSEYRVQGQFVLFKKHSGKTPCSVCVLLLYVFQLPYSFYPYIKIDL